jgi:RNA polymerase sigma-70 factor, ECF subfamily
MPPIETDLLERRAPDTELLSLMRAGQSTAFAVLMRRNNQRLYRLARSIVRDDSEAEEVVQESYVRAFTHIEGFKGESSLATWLARIGAQ